jgi:hypothetical protein
MGWTTKKLLFYFRYGQEIFLFSKASRLALVPTQLCIQLLLGAFYFTYMSLLIFVGFYTKYLLKAVSVIHDYMFHMCLVFTHMFFSASA